MLRSVLRSGVEGEGGGPAVLCGFAAADKGIRKLVADGRVEKREKPKKNDEK